MKRYVSSSIATEQMYVVIVNLNNQPIGYLSNKKGQNLITVQVDPNDLTKAHGILIGNSRSIKTKLRYYAFNSATELDILDGKNYLGVLVNKEFPFRASTGRGSTTYQFRYSYNVADISDLSYQMVPAEEDVEFVDIASACHIYPPVSKTIPDFYTWNFVAGPSGMWKYLFKDCSYDEINRGVDTVIDKFPFLIPKLIAWGEKYREDYRGDIEDLDNVLEFLKDIEANNQFDYESTLYDICEKSILKFLEIRDIQEWTDNLIIWFKDNIIPWILASDIMEDSHLSHDNTTYEEIKSKLTEVFNNLLQEGRI